MYYPTFPDGTIHAINLPADIYKALNPAADGTVNPPENSVHGNYMLFAGYKVKITKYDVHTVPVLDADGKSVLDAWGKPQLIVTYKVRVV